MTIENLLWENQYRCQIFVLYLKNSNFPQQSSFRILSNETISKLSQVVAPSADAALDLVEKGNYIYPVQEDSIAMQMSKLRCNLVYVSQGYFLIITDISSLGLPQKGAYLVFNNNSRFLPAINRQIIMQQTFVQRTYNKYFKLGYKLGPLPKCDDIKKTKDPASTALGII